MLVLQKKTHFTGRTSHCVNHVANWLVRMCINSWYVAQATPFHEGIVSRRVETFQDVLRRSKTCWTFQDELDVPSVPRQVGRSKTCWDVPRRVGRSKTSWTFQDVLRHSKTCWMFQDELDVPSVPRRVGRSKTCWDVPRRVGRSKTSWTFQDVLRRSKTCWDVPRRVGRSKTSSWERRRRLKEPRRLACSLWHVIWKS